MIEAAHWAFLLLVVTLAVVTTRRRWRHWPIAAYVALLAVAGAVMAAEGLPLTLRCLSFVASQAATTALVGYAYSAPWLYVVAWCAAVIPGGAVLMGSGFESPIHAWSLGLATLAGVAALWDRITTRVPPSFELAIVTVFLFVDVLVVAFPYAAHRGILAEGWSETSPLNILGMGVCAGCYGLRWWWGSVRRSSASSSAS